MIVRLQDEVEALQSSVTAQESAGAACQQRVPSKTGARVFEAATFPPSPCKLGTRKVSLEDVERTGMMVEELASAKAQIIELQAQCDRGVLLIEQLKSRLEKKEACKELVWRRAVFEPHFSQAKLLFLSMSHEAQFNPHTACAGTQKGWAFVLHAAACGANARASGGLQ